MSTMKTIEIEKITLNIGAGKPGPELEKGKMLLEKIFLLLKTRPLFYLIYILQFSRGRLSRL